MFPVPAVLLQQKLDAMGCVIVPYPLYGAKVRDALIFGKFFHKKAHSQGCCILPNASYAGYTRQI